MAEAKGRDDWNHTASLMALLANLQRDPKKQPAYKTSDFHPFSRKKKIDLGKAGVGLLKTVFVDGRR